MLLRSSDKPMWVGGKMEVGCGCGVIWDVSCHFLGWHSIVSREDCIEDCIASKQNQWLELRATSHLMVWGRSTEWQGALNPRKVPFSQPLNQCHGMMMPTWKGLAMVFTFVLILFSLEQKCTKCSELGATLACFKRGCNKMFHYACARDSGTLQFSWWFSFFSLPDCCSTIQCYFEVAVDRNRCSKNLPVRTQWFKNLKAEILNPKNLRICSAKQDQSDSYLWVKVKLQWNLDLTNLYLTKSWI